MSVPERTDPTSTAFAGRGEFARFVAVGPLGVGLGALQFELLWLVNPWTEYRASSTWLVSSLVGVLWVHALHCRFTFAATARGRWRATLGRAYLLYTSSVALGTLIMWGLVDEVGVRRTPAWFITTALTSLFNFVVLRRMLGAADRSIVSVDP